MLLALALASALATQTIPARQIEDAVEGHVRARLRSLGSHAQWVVTPGLRDQLVPEGRIAIVVGEPSGRLPRKRVGLPVRLEIDGRLVKTLTAWVEMHDRQAVLVYAEDHPRGRLSEGLRFSRAQVDMVCCTGDKVISPDQLAHMQLAKAVRAGQPAMTDDYVLVPQVRVRQPVEIVAGNEQIRIALRGIAMADGYMGDHVPVRVPASPTLIRSVVIGEGRVHADE